MRYSFHASILLAVVYVAFAQPPAALAQQQAAIEPSQPLLSRLNPDGTLNLDKGFSGSLDPRGWQMLKGPYGEPRFVLANENERMRKLSAAEDENWDGRFGLPGANDNVWAIAVSGDDIYVGGDFTTVGNITVSRIAKWDGNSWSALGSGVSGAFATVNTIAISGSDLYVGGSFGIAGGIGVGNIAKWNSSTNSWSALGSGVEGTALAIAVSNNDVYVGGTFSSAGGVNANRIAKWNASNNTWSALSGGIAGAVLGEPFVEAIAVNGSDVYVGGNFTTAGGVSVSSIARCNSTTNT